MILLSFCFLAFIFNLPTNLSINQHNGWKKITPLKTTRLEVEKILGHSEKKDCNTCEYQTNKEKIIVEYSKSFCEGELKGWNVPSNTVLMFSVTPKKKQKFSELKLNGDEILAFSSALRKYYVDQKTGVVYWVNSLEVIEEISYLPTEADNHLRCKGFLTYNPMGSTYYPDDSFYQKDVQTAKAILDTYIYHITETTGFKCYVIMYSGTDVSKKEYQKLLIQLKRFAFEERKVSPESFEIIDGGVRDLFSVDVFFIKKNYPPPVPSPNAPRIK